MRIVEYRTKKENAEKEIILTGINNKSTWFHVICIWLSNFNETKAICTNIKLPNTIFPLFLTFTADVNIIAKPKCINFYKSLNKGWLSNVFQSPPIPRLLKDILLTKMYIKR